MKGDKKWKSRVSDDKINFLLTLFIYEVRLL